MTLVPEQAHLRGCSASESSQDKERQGASTFLVLFLVATPRRFQVSATRNYEKSYSPEISGLAAILQAAVARMRLFRD